jgi:Niemann-Pick C1 protein
MLSVLLNTTDHPSGLKSFPNVQRSFADVAKVAVIGDITQLFIGYLIVFVYIMVMLGKFSCIEQRAYLAIASISGIIMGIIVAYGFCSGIGLFYGPMHNVLPFLLLGIGIDDMFVIVQSWDTLTETEIDGTLPEKFGKTLSHSGVAITITSLTDVLAFAIGGTTVLPALQSFCLYASVGIVAIYFFQVSILPKFYEQLLHY